MIGLQHMFSLIITLIITKCSLLSRALNMVYFSNRITRDGVKELAKVLKRNTAIKQLDLSYNRLEDDGAMHVAEAVATYNTNLEM